MITKISNSKEISSNAPFLSAEINRMNIQIMIAVCICMIISTVFNELGWKFLYGDMKLEILQKMTACIACLLCCQEDAKVSLKAGVNRLIITVIGGSVGIVVVLIDMFANNQWVMVALIALGVLLTLYLCKTAKVPYINARIGGVTFVLVSCTLGGRARIWYAVFRLVSTLFGVMVVFAVTKVFSSVRFIFARRR